MVAIIATHGVAGIGAAEGASAGISEAAGMRVSVGCFVKAAGGVSDGRLVGMTKTAAVCATGRGSPGGT